MVDVYAVVELVYLLAGVSDIYCIMLSIAETHARLSAIIGSN